MVTQAAQRRCFAASVSLDGSRGTCAFLVRDYVLEIQSNDRKERPYESVSERFLYNRALESSATMRLQQVTPPSAFISSPTSTASTSISRASIRARVFGCCIG